ncbi:unnamed protein product [Toxocara canis]|uniref:Uncharacterized protein n=1 Tax=Toxocara canis TaxID=6265 RepID=A0A183UCK2_TOXCA|nr:unnamed protein product [Toxocara canis]
MRGLHCLQYRLPPYDDDSHATVPSRTSQIHAALARVDQQQVFDEPSVGASFKVHCYPSFALGLIPFFAASPQITFG